MRVELIRRSVHKPTELFILLQSRSLRTRTSSPSLHPASPSPLKINSSEQKAPLASRLSKLCQLISVGTPQLVFNLPGLCKKEILFIIDKINRQLRNRKACTIRIIKKTNIFWIHLQIIYT